MRWSAGCQSEIAAVILAAGAGTRMRSALPKPLHLLCGRPMIDYVLDAAAISSLAQSIVVLSPALDADVQLVDHLEHRVGDNLRIAIQLETLGTGDALRAAIPLLEDVDQRHRAIRRSPAFDQSPDDRVERVTATGWRRCQRL